MADREVPENAYSTRTSTSYYYGACPLGLAGLRELIRRRRRPTILFQF
jgi:hypothetical protein